ncbi:putative zinc-binding oxidoreductase ToxD [Hypomontagnella monticulosa]|nr:putative zinc-binding oxidoreductase ToxD [Hypomontagnella monticulosa]
MASETQNLAIVARGEGVAEITNVPVPKINPGYVRVKTVAVALNPTDWKHIDIHAEPGTIIGADFSGIVEELGPDVTNLKVGDKIAGFVHGGNTMNHEDGSFAEHIVAKAGITLKVPDNITMEEAATLGVGITTVGQGLYQSLELPWPTTPAKEPFPVLIYGGSTATGTLAIQFAKLSGLQVITTCSPHNFDFVKSLGADVVYDYKSPTVGADIHEFTKDKLTHVFDCIAEEGSPEICAQAFSSKGGKYSALLPVEKFPREDVTNVFTLGYTATGEAFPKFGADWPAMPDHFEFASKFWQVSGELLAQGKIKPHPADVREGGLQGVFEGLKELKEGKVSGKKLVYKI